MDNQELTLLRSTVTTAFDSIVDRENRISQLVQWVRAAGFRLESAVQQETTEALIERIRKELYSQPLPKNKKSYSVETVDEILSSISATPIFTSKNQENQALIASILQEIIDATYNRDGSFKCSPLDALRAVAQRHNISVFDYADAPENQGD